MRLDWISARREGVFLPGAETWIDPSIPVARALVTHGHADHARSGHGETIATRETLAIMALRYGAAPASRPLALHERLALDDGIIAWLAPAGHVLGSAQVVLERGGERVVITGDYKRRSDPTCAAFEPVSCDVLITEATFALPVFVHPPIAHEIARLLAAREANP
jgi:putative mRNA 3-end processing factor